jgi:hypothetical protein
MIKISSNPSLEECVILYCKYITQTQYGAMLFNTWLKNEYNVELTHPISLIMGKVYEMNMEQIRAEAAKIG